MTRRKIKADCRGDTRGGGWAGIPICVINSAAYRSCSVHARAILVELVARMNGYNNGSIAVSHRALREALRCSPRKGVQGVVELMERGLIDIAVEGGWKERMAREYRLTFVSKKHAAATNEYRAWAPPRAKSGVTPLVSTRAESVAGPVAGPDAAATDVVAETRFSGRKTAISQNAAATDVEALIECHIEAPLAGAAWWAGSAMLSARLNKHIALVAWLAHHTPGAPRGMEGGPRCAAAP